MPRLGQLVPRRRETLVATESDPGGTGAGWYNVKSFNTKCPEARDTAAHYFNHYYTARDRHFNGWTCHAKQKGEELFKANCVRNRSRHQHVKFEFGS